MGRLASILPLTGFLLLAGVFFGYLQMIRSGEKVISELPSALIDKPVPDFDLPPIAGYIKPGLSSGDFEGKVSVVNVFASWCIPCRAEHEVVTRLAEMGVAAVYGLNYKNDSAQAIAWLEQLGDPYAAIGADVGGRVGIDWGVYGVPETFVIDPAGKIRFKHVGPLTFQALERDVLPVIRELTP